MSLASYLLDRLITQSEARGIERGFLYIEDAFRLTEWGIENGNLSAVSDASAAEHQFEFELKTLMDAAKSPVQLVVSLLLGQGQDPFMGSRKLIQQANATYSQQGFKPVAGL